MAEAMPNDAAPGVALVLHRFSRGGSDRVAAYLARGFADAGMTVRMIVVSRSGETDAVLSDLVGSDMAIDYLGDGRGPRPLDLIRALPALVRRLRQGRPDVVISTANNTALVTAIAHRLARLPGRLYLKTTNPIASSRHTGPARLLRQLSYRWIFGWTDGVWTLSDAERDEMAAAFAGFPGLFRAVTNPYVTPAMLAQRVGPRALPGKTIICVARLTAQKRLDRLIAAFAQVRTPDARLLILGEGEDRAELGAQVAALGLADRVAMPGYHADVAAALRDADLFVLTSDYEGLPAVLLEAMATGLPVLSTDCFPGARALLDEAEGCAIINDLAPASIARQIEGHLARPRPANLRGIAERYSIGNGVLSHIAALMEHPSPTLSASRGSPIRARAPAAAGDARG